MCCWWCVSITKNNIAKSVSFPMLWSIRTLVASILLTIFKIWYSTNMVKIHHKYYLSITCNFFASFSFPQKLKHHYCQASSVKNLHIHGCDNIHRVTKFLKKGNIARDEPIASPSGLLWVVITICLCSFSRSFNCKEFSSIGLQK